MPQTVDPKVAVAEATAAKPKQPLHNKASDSVKESEASKASDKALETLMSKHGSAPESPAITSDATKKTREANGRFAPKADAEQETGERTASEGSKPSDADYQKAMAALKRDGFPEPEAFAKAQPEAFLEFGLKRAKVQSDVDSHTGELQTAKQQLTELQKQQTKEAPATDDGAQPASAEQQSKIADIAEPLVKVLDDLLAIEGMDGVGDPLRKAFTGLAERIVSDVQQLIEKKLSAISEATDETALRAARKSLTEKWPKLAEDDRYQAVLKHLKRLGDDADLPDAEARLDYGCAVEFAPDLVKEARKVLGAKHQWRDNGSPSTESPKASPSGAMTHQELSKASLQARMDRDSSKAEQLDKEMKNRRFAVPA